MLQEGGEVPTEEMFQVFNMGIGMALVVAQKDAAATAKATRGRQIGRIAARHGPDTVLA